MEMKLNPNNIKLAIAAGMLVGSAGLAVPAYAEDVKTKMDVSARIGVACSVVTTDIAFDLYDAVVAHKADDLRSATGKIKQTCTIGSAGTINIDAGKHADGGGVSKRAMKTEEAVSAGQSEYLNYSVHVADDITTTNWPATAGKPYTATGSEQENFVYAFVPRNQNTAVKGAYTDELLVTITY